MNYSPILIVSGEPNSVFLELFFKIFNNNKIKNPIILISSKKLLNLQMKKLGFKNKIRLLNIDKLKFYKLDNKVINLINVRYNPDKAFEKISSKSNTFIKNSFELAFRAIKNNNINKFINGPISKKSFLKNKFLGITEYISEKFLSENTCMLIFNKKLSVCPITTHLPLKLVAKKITKQVILKKVSLINNFYEKRFKFKPRIAILGLNPHCESVHSYNEDEKIIKPSIKYLKRKYNVSGPYPADTIFLKNNRKNFDVIVGMYHDQVLTPIKTLYEYDAINITLGLPFIRISPDHGPNETMLGKNLSNPLSLLRAIKFLDKN
ncbi:pyridoxal phosphate biosynthetic protein PdxA [Candidatus Pelagibacter sp. HTCC7211]|uniref:4-hydroxythreonine-4-phosphate dehydrogenase PdxA n=1 Tax=Pelagibacter sp. (strain HTCC7211) TaxID=439493 RepID=UPI0001839E95|nr:4-hydroxythreonine-4-phosphate dehydrogenase PdxA [Candidatus Pelagibacter sp. HTCC7211]EDZ59759.1 pyridoxal phosphate biosynthetic protein PdxA [Candidatus Pelagibacter sp. HTCC7211]MBD1151080.1 4-hydroxythreonine-4-phosphate dehydrogenase PdxA [Pelagibacterales bacterium SAG-MED25]